MQSANSPLKASDVFRLAVWFGVVSGLLEGVGLVTLQQLDWLNWNIAKAGVTIEIVWISAVFNLLLCVAAASVLLFLGRLFPRLRSLPLAFFSFSLVLLLDLLLLSGRIRESGALVLAVGLATVSLRWFRRHEEAAMGFWRRSVPWAVAAFLFALVGIEGGGWWQEQRAMASLPPGTAGAPNILVLLVDTLRADHLGSYGYARPTSPNMDRLAREGVVFENAIATSSWTLPSHASLLTGRYPHEHGAVKTEFPDRYPTLAEFLRDRGYRTGAISANKIWFTRQRGFGRGFIHFEDYFHSVGDMFARTIYGRKIQHYLFVPLGYEDDPGRTRAADVTAAALHWIGTGQSRPFFLFLNYYDPHDPYLPPRPYRSKFSKRRNPGGTVNTLLYRYYPEMTREQLQDEVDAYDGAIAYADHHIGELIAGLEQRGLAGNTLVVLTSDHGESFGEHGLLVHYNALYRETIHVPLIFFWPGQVPGGTRVPQFVSIAEFPATLLDLLAASEGAPFPGVSLASLWRNAGAKFEGLSPLAELNACPGKEVKKNPCYHGPMKSLISNRWHYIEHAKAGRELYDWQADPQELANLAASPEGQQIAAELASMLQKRLEHPQPVRASFATGGKN